MGSIWPVKSFLEIIHQKQLCWKCHKLIVHVYGSCLYVLWLLHLLYGSLHPHESVFIFNINTFGTLDLMSTEWQWMALRCYLNNAHRTIWGEILIWNKCTPDSQRLFPASSFVSTAPSPYISEGILLNILFVVCRRLNPWKQGLAHINTSWINEGEKNKWNLAELKLALWGACLHWLRAWSPKPIWAPVLAPSLMSYVFLDNCMWHLCVSVLFFQIWG